MFKYFNRIIKGQSLVEYSIMIIIIVAVFLSMKNYVKRAIQGKWKVSVDELGDQYDPRTANSLTNYVISSSSNTFIDVVPAQGGGFWTKRTDTSNTVETKGAQTSVGPSY